MTWVVAIPFLCKILLRFVKQRVASTDAAGESRGRLRTMPSREEETPPLWWGKIAYIIQFSDGEISNECRVFVALITRFFGDYSEIIVSAGRKIQ